MRKRINVMAWVVIVFVWAAPAHAGKLDTLKPDHPRILAHDADFERIAELVKADPLAKRWHAELEAKAQRFIEEPTVVYELRDGKRLLYVSREVLDRVATLGLLYRVEPRQVYLDRIWADMQAAAGFDHWNPSHFLDVAEMAFAFAIAYDWLYDDWAEAQRKTMRDAMIRHALIPGLKAYDDDVWWTRTEINHNQVCNGGLICAALAVGDHEPELVERMLERSIAALPKSMKRYDPDGGYEEGPGYWAYGTTYNAYATHALQSALGNDFGLSSLPGFDVTGDFPVYMTGPTGKVYNFADGDDKNRTSPVMFYLANRFDQAHYAAFAAEHTGASAFALLWYDPSHLQQRLDPVALGAVFHSVGVASVRSSWDDPDAWFVAAKGGRVGYGHSQMDLGSFVLESQGVRWLIDLGHDGYNVPGYFESREGGRRWNFYRNRAEGHNTFVVGDPLKFGDQDYSAKVPIKTTDTTIAMNLSKAYAGQVSRRIELDREAGRVRVVDGFKQDKPTDVWSFFHTRADVAIAKGGKSALLKQGGKQLRVKLIGPDKAAFEHMQARPLPGSPVVKGQANNEGISKLAIRLEGVTDARVEVIFENVE
ncbi:MAG: heparinase II/III-family protein [Phycisphaeraceae bacterium]|nr:heparinase II/III-family protein [Phycisphaeraceae bacterium]